ncbi:MAG TPA: adenosylmethionine--8-amino-7-oxononanoate transaminase [Candidatus Paceibacterota bacterium]|nr:adenosylmethionine--8-amino-7-oxononanoate transaminase [Verrucomicrobiota bacterium]HRZ46037.1 adenosylmethionine--8-amino-7-oxononanoate transaminase [Candidatus Paceibacterota bacterium]HRZ92543.1 adenosylmethionine--8-amino-7-oxononanoate transaminase [Candidatus Paceibacterota bacterium]
MIRPIHPLVRLDRKYVWHPFTQMKEWCAREPILILSGQGALLRDHRGREYLDANASIWTNLHGHRHPAIDAALKRQIGRIAHCSALGLANEPASRVAAELIRLARSGWRRAPAPRTRPGPSLAKVFYSDDGSTALEVALKMAYEHCRRSGHSKQPRFLSPSGAYHGDTIGAVSLGHIDLFHAAYRGLLFRTDTVMAPYCYRCPHNRARPDRLDARQHRACRWECTDRLEAMLATARRRGRPYGALVVEPLVQGAAGMIPQPAGWLARAASLARAHDALLVADEVMTGFGRTGPCFACHQERVRPDFMAVSKGLSGGYLPLGATLATRTIFNSFLGEYREFKTFFHGHSYTANPLACAAALASIRLLESAASIRHRQRLDQILREESAPLWTLPAVGDVRQIGLILGVELVRNWRTREPWPLEARAGARVCAAMARNGVLTRPIGNVLVIMPPYAASADQVRRMMAVLRHAIAQSFPSRYNSPGSL